MTLHLLLFWVFAIATGGAAIAVVASQNVVRMAFWLIISLGSSAGLFFLAGADFVAAAQLLVYVGGTLVLLIFGVMLTASGPFMGIKTSPGEGLMGGIIGAALFGLLATTVATINWDSVASRSSASVGTPRYTTTAEGNSARSLGLAFLGARPDRDLNVPGRASPSHRKGEALSPGYLLPFEIVSVHLLVVLIGAAYLARAKRRLPKGTTNG